MTPDIIRAWAKAQGIEIGDRGRVKAEIREAYLLAHQGSPKGNIAETLKPAPHFTSIAAPTVVPSVPVAKARQPRAPKPKPEIRVDGVRLAGGEPAFLTKGDPMRVVGEQGNWRFLGMVLEPDGTVYIDCVDPNGSGRAIRPAQVALAHKSVTRSAVAAGKEEMTANAMAATRRGRQGV